MSRFRKKVVLGIAGASRSCFPKAGFLHRLETLVRLLNAKFAENPDVEIVCNIDAFQDVAGAQAAARYLISKGVNAVVLFGINFTDEQADVEFVRAMKAAGIKVMLIGAAEESKDSITPKSDGTCGRGDYKCGLLSENYGMMTAGFRPGMDYYIPPEPVGTPDELVPWVEHFIGVIATYLAMTKASVGVIGGRPNDFVTCETRESIRLFGPNLTHLKYPDLMAAIAEAKKPENRTLVDAVFASMKEELGEGGQGEVTDELLRSMAEYEVALKALIAKHGLTCAGQECWPLFEGLAGFVPCYVMSRLDAQGIPVVCEGDGNGAWTQVGAQAASNKGATMLDFNHSISADLLVGTGVAKKNAGGLFHCGRTCKDCLKEGACLKFQLIMASLMPKERTWGTMEGTIKPGPVTVVRVHHHPSPPEFGGGHYQAFVVEGEIMDLDPSTFGGTGILKFEGLDKFYRDVMLEHGFPHHVILCFGHCGKILIDALTMMGMPVYENKPGK